jgi:hypothetical protein
MRAASKAGSQAVCPGYRLRSRIPRARPCVDVQGVRRHFKVYRKYRERTPLANEMPEGAALETVVGPTFDVQY